MDRLEAVLGAGLRLPLGSKVVVDEGEILDILDQMRVAIPEEIKEARRTVQERERILAQAQKEAEGIVIAAQERVAFMLQDRELLKAAENRSQAIIEEAREKSRQLQADADQYALDTLTNLENELLKILNTTRGGIEMLKRMGTEGRPRSSSPGA